MGLALWSSLALISHPISLYGGHVCLISCCLVASPLNDPFGRKPVFLVGLIFEIMSSIRGAAAAAQSIWQFKTNHHLITCVRHASPLRKALIEKERHNSNSFMNLAGSKKGANWIWEGESMPQSGRDASSFQFTIMPIQHHTGSSSSQSFKPNLTMTIRKKLLCRKISFYYLPRTPLSSLGAPILFTLIGSKLALVSLIGCRRGEEMRKNKKKKRIWNKIWWLLSTKPQDININMKIGRIVTPRPLPFQESKYAGDEDHRRWHR